MNGKFGKASWFAKTMVVLALAFLLGLGLCGVSFVVASHGFQSKEEFGVDSIGIAGFSLIVMILSVLGLIVTIFVRVVTAISRSLSPNQEGSEPQTLLGDENDENKSK